jgi:guanine deaminase
MHRAIDIARQGIDAGQMPFGAAIVRNGRVIACEHNSVKATRDPTAHAEVSAIRVACRKLGRKNLHDCLVFSTCEPCAMCAGACYNAGVPVIYFGASIADKDTFGLPDLGIGAAILGELSRHAPKAVAGLCRKECLELFELYVNQKTQPTAKP